VFLHSSKKSVFTLERNDPSLSMKQKETLLMLLTTQTNEINQLILQQI